MREDLENQVIESKQSRNLKMETTGVVVQEVAFMENSRSDTKIVMVVSLQMPFREISMRDLREWMLETFPQIPRIDGDRIGSFIPERIQRRQDESSEFVCEVEGDEDEEKALRKISWRIKYFGRDHTNPRSPYLVLKLAFEGYADDFEDWCVSYAREYLEALR